MAEIVLLSFLYEKAKSFEMLVRVAKIEMIFGQLFIIKWVRGWPAGMKSDMAHIENATNQKPKRKECPNKHKYWIIRKSVGGIGAL